jgi:AraC family transcriptional activator of pobA
MKRISNQDGDKIPLFDLLSWSKPEKWLREYFVVFTERFATRHKPLADLIFDLPFFHMEKTIPFEVGPGDLNTLTDVFRQIGCEYRSTHPDRYDLISAYTLTLLLHVRRLYTQYVETDPTLSAALNGNESQLIGKFRSLLRTHISGGAITKVAHTVEYYAGLLSTHPNHLNALLRRKTGETASSLVHRQLLTEARSLLGQTSLSVKEIAFQLGFNEPAHFNHFFKRMLHCTPMEFRKQLA